MSKTKLYQRNVWGWWVGILLLGFLPCVTLAQNNGTSRPLKSAKALPATIHAPEGITRDQAGAILLELRQIRQLLERTQSPVRPTTALPPKAPQDESVKMSLVHGSYSLGREDAPVTLVEFADYQCPFCRRFHNEAFAELKRKYIDTGKLRFISRDLPLDFHANALRAAMAARCAGEQGKYWEMRDVLIANSAEIGQDSILKYAQGLPLDMNSFQACVTSERFKAEIQRDVADAGALQISGTPSFVLGKTANDVIEGVRIVGAQPYSTFEAGIRRILDGKVERTELRVNRQP